MLTETQALELARRVVSLTTSAGAEQAEAIVSAESSGLTRFAGNRIHQNVAEDDARVNVRAVVGARQGVAATNRLDDASLAQAAAAAVRAARVSPDDDAFPGLPGAGAVVLLPRASHATLHFGPEARGDAARSIIGQSASRGLSAAGTVSASVAATAIANSHGVAVAQTVTACAATVLSSGEDGGTGWASFLHQDSDMLDPASLGDDAATLAQRSSNPGDLEPGSYSVVLAPEAVATLLDMLSYTSFSGRAVAENRSFMSAEQGTQVMSPLVTIADDALASEAMGLTFDYEGCPKRRVVLVENGRVGEAVYDSYWAAKAGHRNTGHALPAMNTFGPYPLNLEMAPGDASLDSLIAGVERGVYVTRFHYVNVEDPVPVLLTGMTRDGTFLIENGRLTRPLKNQRFTQSLVSAFATCTGVTSDRRFVGTEDGAALVPGVLLGEFAFTGQTG